MIIDKKSIQNAIERLLDHAPGGSKVILFGSYARESAGPFSDIDFLVIEPDVSDRIRESARLRLVLQPVLSRYMIPVDVLVLSESQFNRWRNVPNTVYYHANKEGEVYERAM